MRGADLDAQDVKGYSALHYAVESTSVKMVRQLVECSENVNIQNGDGNTPLHLVVNSNNCEIFKELSRNRDLDTSIINNNNVDPLTLAVMTNQLRIMSLLLNFNQAYDKQDVQGKTPLHWACMVEGPCVINRLIDRSKENIQDIYGDTPLSLAIKVNNERAVDLLLNTRHFDPSTRDSNGNSTLHMVCHLPNPHIIQLVIEGTVAVNSRNAFGETPLHHACSSNNVFAVEELKKLYVDRNAQDSKQQTPLIVAACNNGTAVAKSLFYNNDFAISDKSVDGATEISNNKMQIDIRSSVFLDAAD
jgi:ankyrin repeat protein